MAASRRFRGLINRFVPSRLVCWVRWVGYLPADLLDAIRGRRDPLSPPRRLAFRYGFDPEFRTLGRTFLSYLVDLAALKPDERILDIGCGIGRLALPLTGYLSAKGGYCGFDTIPEGIRWCRRHITPRFPNFRFEVADIANRTYNPHGRLRAAEYRFPCADASIDVVVSKSVFTHMLPGDVEHYLAETARVLRPGGCCLHTFFLVTAEARAGMDAGRSAFDFRWPGEGYWTVSPGEPEKAIALEEEAVRAMYRRCGLTIAEPVRYGSWSGRQDFLSGQDIIVAIKPV